MAQKFPPPPQLITGKELDARALREFGFQLNRWLLAIQNILNAGGFIDPNEVEGLVAAYAQIDANTADIATLQTAVALNTADIALLIGEVATNTANIATLQTNVTTLQTNVTALLARNQVLHGNGGPPAPLGNDGDLYSNDTGGVGTNLYSKRAGVWVAIA